MPHRIAVLGATGSIGSSALAVIRQHRERFQVAALTAYRQWERLLPLVVEFTPDWAVVVDERAAAALREIVAERGLPTRVLSGHQALVEVAANEGVDTVVAAIVGAAGLPSTFAAVAAGKRVLLANKEALVVAGEVLMATARERGALLLPVDSEHNGLFQCLAGAQGGKREVRRLVLTASGGPFRTRDPETFPLVTPSEACAHPNWSMGRKISVDSATMMNKGLEVIEAHWLFGLPLTQIEVLVHPQSVVHALVEYADGSVIAHLSEPDMRVPIAYALAWPNRIASGANWLDLAKRGVLTFERPDGRRFPCLGLAYEALRMGGTAPAVLNAANEVAVTSFLAGDLSFDRISAVIAETLAGVPLRLQHSLEEALAADAEARAYAARVVARGRSIGGGR
ncbi:MAG: 1-deoxy-D-xylulose-5-phosphate reductoisomerase [Hydrogenophilus sp.]|nr:1-deoxy-D-xylulose-5-phosphate reductoisomerase [Hydrogenophilus sp.]